MCRRIKAYFEIGNKHNNDYLSSQNKFRFVHWFRKTKTTNQIKEMHKRREEKE
jgi:hypothetical protein